MALLREEATWELDFPQLFSMQFHPILHCLINSTLPQFRYFSFSCGKTKLGRIKGDSTQLYIRVFVLISVPIRRGQARKWQCIYSPVYDIAKMFGYSSLREWKKKAWATKFIILFPLSIYGFEIARSLFIMLTVLIRLLNQEYRVFCFCFACIHAWCMCICIHVFKCLWAHI